MPETCLSAWPLLQSLLNFDLARMLLLFLFHLDGVASLVAAYCKETCHPQGTLPAYVA